ncbi:MULTISPECIES: hypothetical protein [Bacillus cereus group]|uniref:hypothetical protein n=1 Tax=Bacillus cereus group TaxID=86661 RepID=UPI00124F6E47|nr:hypothetical protein [Bacillus cereus]KAB2421606.1 hypothetical protein F8167_18470 [Bacillus cereus]
MKEKDFLSEKDYYKILLKGTCKINNIHPRKPRFEYFSDIEELVLIHIKNHLEDGVDIECFKILYYIHQTVIPLGIKYTQQLYFYPNGHRLDRITVQFKKEEYILLNQKIKTGDISN